MRARMAVPLALLFVCAGLWGWVNPDAVSSWFDNVIVQEDDDATIVGLYSEEEWLIVIVDFAENPAAPGLDVQQAKNMLTGTNGIGEYLGQLSGGQVELNLTIHQEVIRAEHPVDYYGADGSDTRDSGREGSDGPATLAEQVVNELSDVIEWQRWDLNQDGVVDRLIILHTSKPQEDSGSSSKIWSHFGPLPEPISVSGDVAVEHYTMASFRSSNYRGTIIHESLHQHGAIDLYSVHDVVRKDPWNGVGDWDIMASGNWNGNGATPSLPMAATIEHLAIDRHQSLPDNWPEPITCENQLIAIEPQTMQGQSLKVELSDGEYIWAEYRSDAGFDSQLPGEGLLVSIQNTNIDGMEENDANSDSRNPYLRIVEADQDNGLISGSDEGSSGDVFQVGDVFGSEGIEIRNRFGFLVPWKATVEYDFSGVILNFSSSDCSPTFSVQSNETEFILLGNQTVNFEWETTHSCEPMANLTSSDGRELEQVETGMVLQPNQDYSMELSWSSTTMAGTKGNISGNFSCGTGIGYDVSIPWYSVGIIPLTNEYSSTIPYSDLSTVSISLETVGEGERIFSLEIEGALSRISETENLLPVSKGTNLVLEIDPNGLLTPGMLARGEIILTDENGIEYEINVTLTAETMAGTGGFVDIIREPGTMFLVVGLLCALWILLGIRTESKVEPITNHVSENTFENFVGTGPPEY